jgi:hypothetical protein
MVATVAERMTVVQLEALACHATSAQGIHVSAAAPISLVHGPTHRRRDMS